MEYSRLGLSESTNHVACRERGLLQLTISPWFKALPSGPRYSTRARDGFSP